MPEIVEAHFLHAVPLDESGKLRGQVIGLHPLAQLIYEYKAVVFIVVAVHLFGIGMPKRNLFFRKNRKNFLKRLSISKTSPHLFPSGEGFRGQYF